MSEPIPTKPTPEEIAATIAEHQRRVDARTKLRSERDALMTGTDMYAMRDYPINDETFNKWRRYRVCLHPI